MKKNPMVFWHNPKIGFSSSVICIIALILLFIVGACSSEKSGGKAEDNKISVKENAGSVQVKTRDGSLVMEGNENSGSIKIKTEAGEKIEVAYDKDKLSDGFPEDIPIYSSSKITMSQVLNNGTTALASLTTSDDASSVLKYYKEALSGQGWSVEGEMNMGEMVLLQGKKDGRMVNISIIKDEGTTNITLAVTEE